MQIKFSEFHDVELILEIEILTNLDFETAYKIEDKVNIKIDDTYPKSTTDNFWLYITDEFD